MDREIWKKKKKSKKNKNVTFLFTFCYYLYARAYNLVIFINFTINDFVVQLNS